MEVVEIRHASNGYMVYPSDSRGQGHICQAKDIKVFESFAALVKWLESDFSHDKTPKRERP